MPGLAPIFWSAGRLETQSFEAFAGLQAEGAVVSLKPERVLLLPDGEEDLWNEEYLDLIMLE